MFLCGKLFHTKITTGWFQQHRTCCFVVPFAVFHFHFAKIVNPNVVFHRNLESLTSGSHKKQRPSVIQLIDPNEESADRIEYRRGKSQEDAEAANSGGAIKFGWFEVSGTF